MEERMTLEETLTAAANQYSWDSRWTQDGFDAPTLGKWRDQGFLTPTERVFTFDGTKIVRRGADMQDYRIEIYLAEEQCGICERFVLRSTDEQEGPQQPEKMVVSVFCIDCVSGGVIGKLMDS